MDEVIFGVGDLVYFEQFTKQGNILGFGNGEIKEVTSESLILTTGNKLVPVVVS